MSYWHLFILMSLVALCCSATTSAANTPAIPPLPQNWQATGMVVDDFDGGKFVGPFADKDGSTITQDVVPHADGRGGSFLLTQFKIVAGGNAGMWAKAGKGWDKKQDWTKATSLSLLICTSRPMRFELAPKSEGRNYVAGFAVTQPLTWQRITLPLKTWQGIASGIGQVSDYDLHLLSEGEGWYAIDDIRIEGAVDAAAAPPEPKVEMDPKVIFAKTLVPPTERSNKTYIVDATSQAAEADGSAANPFRTIQQAADRVLPGDTVLIRDGTYREQASPGQTGILINRSGAPDAWIRFAAYPGHHPKITSSTWVTLRLSEVAYIEIDGLDVSTEVIPNQTGDNKDRNSGNGIMPEKSHHIRIRNCTVHDCGGAGIGSGYCDYITVENSRVFRNSFYSIYNCSGISLWEGRDLDDAPGFHNIIRGNISYENENKGPTPLYGGELTDGNGIILDWLRGNGAALVENNLCYRNGGRGIVSTHSRNVIVRNNTLVGNDFTSRNSDMFAGGSASVLFVNNLCVAAPGIKVSNRTWQSTDITYSHNLFFGYDKVDEPLGQGNITDKDPRLDPQTFKPLPNGPALDTGDPSNAPSTDLAGAPRPKGKSVDLGAYEQ